MTPQRWRCPFSLVANLYALRSLGNLYHGGLKSMKVSTSIPADPFATMAQIGSTTRASGNEVFDVSSHRANTDRSKLASITRCKAIKCCAGDQGPAQVRIGRPTVAYLEGPVPQAWRSNHISLTMPLVSRTDRHIGRELPTKQHDTFETGNERLVLQSLTRKADRMHGAIHFPSKYHPELKGHCLEW